MEVFMLGFVLAMISGAMMSIQGVFNTSLTKQSSLWVSTGWVHFSAFCNIYRGYIVFFTLNRPHCLNGGNNRNLMLYRATAEKHRNICFHKITLFF